MNKKIIFLNNMFIFSSKENKEENKEENGQNKQEDNLGKALRNKIVRNNWI